MAHQPPAPGRGAVTYTDQTVPLETLFWLLDLAHERLVVERAAAVISADMPPRAGDQDPDPACDTPC